MLKKILYICLLLLAMSCEKIFINGDLDGMWRLQSIENEGSVVYPDSIYYSFQRHLVMMGIFSETELPKNWYMGCFTYEGDSVTINNFYRYPGTDGICMPEELENLHIYDTIVGFKVEHLDDKVLILSESDRKYSFRKW